MKGKTNIFIGAFAVCLLVVLSGLNRPHLSPFTTAVQFERLSALAQSEDYIVALDKHQDRLLIGNKEGELISVVDMTKTGSPADKISGIALRGDSIYLIGSTNFYEGSYLSSENVLLYNTHGKFIRELYNRQYAPDDFQSQYALNAVISGDCDSTLSCVQGLIFSRLYAVPDDAIDHMDYSCGFMLYNILFWFSLVVLVIAVLYVLLKIMRKVTPNMRKTIPLAVLVALVTASFYTINSFRQVKTQYEHNISTQTRQFAYLLTHFCGQEHILRDSIPVGMRDQVLELISPLNDANGIEQSVYTIVCLVDDEGNISSLVDCQNFDL